MKRTFRVMALAIGLGAFTVAGFGSVAMAKECKAGKHKVLKIFCCKDKSKPAEKKTEKSEKK